eukprot:CAMPEP_0204486884 /NCGR_PEP_ID=MMETSP0471-20130131/65395_1 /ASSEMBLY_ACC=CAM_ASM_000602 /TAXON_ID=2969 /ORGANISM="Oxyrrhis marina" /LENGTH=58 /DNA_ID=CAMNT_0051490525 /DNA_START=413 /DNA_END=586 /DNA_ORIENTATION=-
MYPTELAQRWFQLGSAWARTYDPQALSLTSGPRDQAGPCCMAAKMGFRTSVHTHGASS